jgi:hypothetical protein
MSVAAAGIRKRGMETKSVVVETQIPKRRSDPTAAAAMPMRKRGAIPNRRKRLDPTKEPSRGEVEVAATR